MKTCDPAGIFDVDSTSNEHRKSVEKRKNISTRRKSVEILTFDVESTSIFQRFEKMSKSVKKSTSIRRRIAFDVEILTMPAGDTDR